MTEIEKKKALLKIGANLKDTINDMGGVVKNLRTTAESYVSLLNQLEDSLARLTEHLTILIYTIEQDQEP